MSLKQKKKSDSNNNNNNKRKKRKKRKKKKRKREEEIEVHRCRFIEFTPSSIVSVALSKDSKELAVGRSSGSIEIWSITNNWYITKVRLDFGFLVFIIIFILDFLFFCFFCFCFFFCFSDTWY